MATTAKKSSHTSHAHSHAHAPKLAAAAHSATKVAAHGATKGTASALSAMESTRSSAQSIVKFGSDTAKEFFATGSEETQKAHEKFFAVGREGVENVSRAVDALTRTLTDFVAIARENADAAVEVNHIAADIAKSINSELVSYANANFSDNVELVKEAFALRDISDAIELHNKWISTNVDNFFSQFTRLSEMTFQLATEAAEPINERVAEATERFSKSLAA